MSEQSENSLLARYQRLVDTTLDLASTLDLNILLKRIVQAAADLINAEAASILLYEEINQQLYFKAATNLTEPVMQDLSVPVDASIAGWVLKERQPIILNEAQKDPRHFGHISRVTDLKTRSLVAVPLIAKDKVVGVLEVINKRQGEFNQADMELASALGAQAAVAIENARLFQQSDLIAELIHELRTPLASISTASHLLLRPEVSEEQRSRMGEIINDETRRLSDMAASYLDLARLESGRTQFSREPFKPGELLHSCLEIMTSRANEKGIALTACLPEDLPVVRGDKNKIKQVVLNLLSNAIKYNRPGGGVRLSAWAEAENLVIDVSDTGAGILPESIPHLFEKFYRAPGSEKLASGTGLGLSISKRIVEMHRGHILVKSEAGAGSSFTVYLPL